MRVSLQSCRSVLADKSGKHTSNRAEAQACHREIHSVVSRRWKQDTACMVDTSTLQVFEPYPGVFAYYDGRIPGKRLHSQKPNWLDDDAYELGAASYAIVDGGD